MINSIHVPALGITLPLGSFTLFVGPNGSGKTTVLRSICQKHGNARASTMADREDAYRHVDTILLVPKGDPRHLYTSEGAHAVHDAIVAALTAARTGTPCLLDNLGAMLHPKTAMRLVKALRGIGGQIIATTHSPYVVDQYDPDDVIVLCDGKYARLSQHPEAARHKGMLSAGQLWSLDDEASWVPNAKETA